MESVAMTLDSTVRSQNSNNSKDSKISSNVDSKTESCLESKHSKEILITEKQQRQQHRPESRERRIESQQKFKRADAKDDCNLLMFTCCGQLLLGVVLVVFGVLVLVHGASLSGTGAGLWAGAGALVAGALGIVATVATSSTNSNSVFATAHLASSLVALALSNMSAIMALTAIVRDSQRAATVSLLVVPGEDRTSVATEDDWSALLANIGLLVASTAELLVSGYCCLTLTPKLCGCLRPNQAEQSPATCDGRLKARNMVHQWVITQNNVAKNQPIYVVQPVVPMHSMIQPSYRMPPACGKLPAGFVPTGPLPMASYDAVPALPPMTFMRSPPRMMRPKHKRHPSTEQEDGLDRKRHTERRNEPTRRMSLIDEDQVDLTQTYTGLDKRISEEFISIAMDPDRKSKASSSHGSEIGITKPC